MDAPMPRGDQLSRQWRLIQLIDRAQGITVDAYLVGHCHLRDAVCIFAVERMRTGVRLIKRAPRPERG